MADRAWNSLFLWVVEFKVLAGIDPLDLQQIVQEGHADQTMKQRPVQGKRQPVKSPRQDGAQLTRDREHSLGFCYPEA